MISFKIENNLLILIYDSFDSNNKWVYQELDKKGKYTFKKIFTFLKSDLYKVNSNELENDFDKPVEFIFAKLVEDYFKVEKRVLSIDQSLFIYKSIILSSKFFVA